MRLHYLQHVPFENPGSILVWAGNNGVSVTCTKLYEEQTFPKQEEFDWLVVMGGPMNIYEEDIYPWLVKEKIFLKESIAAGKIILGLCLGAQLLADVAGGKVTKNPIKEIGWLPVQLHEEVRKNPLFSFFPPNPTVFQWHGDTFQIPPEGAEWIAHSEACRNQAFIYRKRVFGFQFHLENTPEIIRGLVDNCRDEMVAGPYVQTPDEVLNHPEYIAQDNIWMSQFLTKLYQLDRKGDFFGG